jgi:hypothetical protein
MTELIREERINEEDVAKLSVATDENKAKKYDRQIR